MNPQYLQKILLKTYERAPEDFEALLGIEGVGAGRCGPWRSRPS